MTEPAVPPPAAVAIVGMGCILPGASDLQAFWANIVNKFDAITEVPADRWDWRQYFDPDRTARDKIYSRWGGFIRDVPFDPALFGIPPSSLRSIEPFQLLALAVVRAALEDAGYLERPFPRERTSVILGAGGGGSDLTAGYIFRSCLPSLFGGDAPSLTDRLGGNLPAWTEDSFPGLLMNVAAGRVANRFDLGGVNCTVDAACASSLAAVYLAVRDLEARTSDVVVVGGVDGIQNPFAFLCFSKTQALSPTGRCRTFDAQGDGIAISEGFGAVVMKRLEDAERDGDHIYAVIRGVGGSSDGRDRSMTAPRPEGQVRALERGYSQAGFSPATVGLIEAHGTGTVAGDQAEVQALTAFFSQAGAGLQNCAVGSVKSMIGHTKATAGVASLIKVALSLNHRVLPPTLGVNRPNPKANFPTSPFYVNTETRPWILAETTHPRRAGVSAFGFGGTNFHIVLEEYTGRFLPDRRAPLDPWPAELFVWRGRTREEVLGQITRLVDILGHGARPRLSDLAYTTVRLAGVADVKQTSLAVVASSLDDLIGKIRSAQDLLRGSAQQEHDNQGIHFAHKPLAGDGRIAFLFPGQGSQYVNMARDVAVAFDEVRECFERADRFLSSRLEQPLSRSIFPPPVFDSEEGKRLEAALTETSIAQPALGATDLAFVHLLRRLGLEPHMVAGHSFGEFVALSAAGCFDEETLLDLAAARGRFIRECTTEESGAMAAVVAAPEELQPLLAEPGLTLANLNAPRQTVISGSRADVEQAISWCQARGLQARLLPVACAFHSPLVAPAQHRLAELLHRVSIDTPRVQVFSNTTATAYPEDPAAIADLLSDHLIRPVEFVRQVEAMYEAGARLFVEVGPRNILSGLVSHILGDRSHVCAPLDILGRPGLVQLLHALAALVSEGAPAHLDRLFVGRSVKVLEFSELANETGQPRYSPTTWLVSGGRARPVAQNGRSVNTPALPLRIAVIDGEKPPIAPPVEIMAAGTPSRGGGDDLPPGGARGAAITAATRTADQSSRGSTRNGPGVTQSGPGMSIPGPLPRQSGNNGGTMSQSTVQSPRVLGPAAPQERRVAPWAEVLPAPPPTPPTIDYGRVELVRQFQQVMMRFLQTQETVMHDLLAFLGTQGAITPQTHPGTRALGGEISGNGSTVLRASTIAPTLAPQSPARAYDGTPSAPAPASHAVDDGVSQTMTPVGPSRGVAGLQTDHVPRTAAAGNGAASERASHPTSSHQVVVAPPNRQQLTERLLAIVSERTGYPQEMLTLDADLEADLGIDSIKRVEIAGTFIQSLELPAGHAPDIEKLTLSRTLRQVIENLESLILPAAGTDPPPQSVAGERAGREGDQPPFEDARTGHGIGRFALKLTLAPSIVDSAGLARSGAVIILDDATGVGKHIADRLGASGYHAVRVVSGADDTPAGDPGILVADLSRKEEIDRLVGELHDRHGPAVALIHLAGLRPGAHEVGVNPERWSERLTSDLYALFLMAQALGPDLRRAAAVGGAAVLAATSLGGTSAVDLPAEPLFPGDGGIIGFLKTLAQEWPDVRVKAVDLSPTSPQADADRLCAELMAADGIVEIGYRDGQRLVLELVPSPHYSEEPGLPLDGDSILLITGGARGITARAALKLAETARPTLLLVGRTPLPTVPEPRETVGLIEPQSIRRALIEQLGRTGRPVTPALVEEAYRQLLHAREVRENLERLRQTGARVEYLICDVRDVTAFGNLIDDVYRSFGRIDGVIHGAGVIEDRLTKDKTLESFRRVVETKVNSALVLAGKLYPESLRFLVFFSSVAGRFGNRGQGDYAAASEVLNKLAQDLDRRWPGRVVSINWGPWLQAGMVSPEVQRQFTERGVTLIPPEVGCRMLEEELRFGRKGAVEVVIGGIKGTVTGPESRPAPAVPTLGPRSGNGRDDWAGTDVSALPLLATAGALSRREGIVEVMRPLDPEVDLYLRDHCLDGHPVLPVAMAMELMAEVAAAGWPGLEVVELRQMRLLRGIVVGRKGQTVRVVARPRAEATAQGDGINPGMMLDLAIFSAEDPRRVHYQAVIGLGTTPNGAQALETARFSEEVGVLEGARPLPMSIEDAYRDWLFHGPLFQGIVSVEAIGPRGARAILRPSSPRDNLRGNPSGEWLIDPIVIDSAYQMQILWARVHWDMTLLPARFQAYHRIGPLRGAGWTQGVRHELRIRSENQAPMSHADHYFFGPDGRLLGAITHTEGMGSKALNRLAGGRQQ
jgi:acyl transferase domain-containing protein/NAD(P)-dependent dehydrogenase (short-subunit alcohol dehydrogenase family)